MGRFISVDLRQRILRMILSGASCRQAARHFGAGESTAIRLRRGYLDQGTIEPKPQGGQLGRSKLNPFRDIIVDAVKANPDITLMQLRAMIAEEKGIKVSVFCVWAFLKSEKMSFKKTLYATERHRDYVVEAYFIWHNHCQPAMRLKPHRLYFIDETFVDTKMVRAYGWGIKSERLVADAPFGHWLTQTFVAALRCDGLCAPWVLNHPMCRESFDLYIETQLAPILLGSA